MSEVSVSEMNCGDFCDYLLKEGFHEDVISSFSSNRISGASFCALNEEDLKELLPVIGDRARMRKLLQEVNLKENATEVNGVTMICY